MSGTTPRFPVTLWRADLPQGTHTQRETERVTDTDTDTDTDTGTDARMDTHANANRPTHNPATPAPTHKRTRTPTYKRTRAQTSPGSHVASREKQKGEPKVGPKKNGNIAGAWEGPLIERYLEIERRSESR